MGKKVKDTSVAIDASSSARPRLVKIIIKNFRSIGAVPVSIDLDDIVVLVGPNNAGKSSVLKAYEVIMQASKEGQLTIEDFPSGVVDPKALPEIELHTVVYDNGPGPEWVQQTSTGEKLVRELWQWPGPGAATRRGYNVIEDRWANDDDKE